MEEQDHVSTVTLINYSLEICHTMRQSMIYVNYLNGMAEWRIYVYTVNLVTDAKVHWVVTTRRKYQIMDSLHLRIN